MSVVVAIVGYVFIGIGILGFLLTSHAPLLALAPVGFGVPLVILGRIGHQFPAARRWVFALIAVTGAAGFVALTVRAYPNLVAMTSGQTVEWPMLVVLQSIVGVLSMVTCGLALSGLFARGAGRGRSRGASHLPLVFVPIVFGALALLSAGCGGSKGKVSARDRTLADELSNDLTTVTESDRGLIVSLSDILFDFDQATLRPEVEDKLAQVADILAGYPDLPFSVEGHTDSVGRDDYNLDLSRRRAQAVADFLGAHGVAPERMEVRGYGETSPKDSNETEEGRQANRRVDLVIPEQ